MLHQNVILHKNYHLHWPAQVLPSWIYLIRSALQERHWHRLYKIQLHTQDISKRHTLFSSSDILGNKFSGSKSPLWKVRTTLDLLLQATPLMNNSGSIQTRRSRNHCWPRFGLIVKINRIQITRDNFVLLHSEPNCFAQALPMESEMFWSKMRGEGTIGSCESYSWLGTLEQVTCSRSWFHQLWKVFANSTVLQFKSTSWLMVA